MYIHDRIAELPGGDPAPANTTVFLKRVLDDSTVTTESTDADGFVTFIGNGSPGPVYMQVDVGGETRIRHGSATNQVGSWYEGEWEVFVRSMTDGVIGYDGNKLAVTPGTGLSVVVGTGAALGSGILSKFHTSEVVAVDANGTGTTRYDAICLAIWVQGAEKGRSELRVVHGGSTTVTTAQIEAARPADAKMIVLALVRVQSGAAVIQASDITDQRVIASPLQGKVVGTEHIIDGAVGSAQLATGAVTNTKIADNAITAAKIAADAVGASEIAANAVGTSELATGAVTGAKIANSTITLDKLAQAVKDLIATSGGTGIVSDDENFDPKGIVYGGFTTLGTCSVSLSPGTWVIQTITTFTARGSYGSGQGSGTFTTRLVGNGTPQGANQSSRIFQTVQGVPRQVILSGRVQVTTSSTTSYSGSAQVAHTSGAQTDVRDGVVYMMAWKK